MAGPKGHQVTLPFFVDGELLFTMRRASQYERRVYRHHPACSSNHRLDRVQQCVECKEILEAESVADVDAMVGVSDPPETPEGKAQRAVAAAIPQQARQAMAERAQSAVERAHKTVEETPLKQVCSKCKKDYNGESCLHCSVCESFVSNPGIAFERDGQLSLLLTEAQLSRLHELKLSRGLHFIGVLPSGFRFEEWQTGESFSLVPDQNNIRVHEFRTALHYLNTGALVYYCSAEENKGYTLKNEWVAVIRTAKKGRSLLLTQLRADEDTAHREHNLGAYTEGVHDFMGLFMARRVDEEYLKVFKKDSKARTFLSRLLAGAGTLSPLAGLVRMKNDITAFIKRLQSRDND